MWISKKRLEAMFAESEERVYHNVVATMLQKRTQDRAGLLETLDRSMGAVTAEAAGFSNEVRVALRQVKRYEFADFGHPITVSEVLQAILTHLKISVVKSPERVEVVKKGGPEKP